LEYRRHAFGANSKEIFSRDFGREVNEMKNIILASASALALLTVAACSDSTDTKTTQSTTSPPAEQPATPPAATPPAATPPAATTPAPETGTGGATQGQTPAQPAPAP